MGFQDHLKEKLFKGQRPYRTICETIRDIYYKTNDREIQELCIEATDYAKRMDAKLREYKDKYNAPDYAPEVFQKESTERMPFNMFRRKKIADIEKEKKGI